MKALRAMLGAVIVMAATVMIFSITLSSPRVLKEDPRYRFPGKEERGMSPPSSHLLSSPSQHVISPLPSAQTPFNSTTTSQIPTTALSSAAANAPSSPTHLHSQTTETTETERTEETAPQNVLFDSDMIGHLNYDIWRHPVGYCVDDLRIKRDFPSRPETRKSIDQLQTTFSAKDKDSLVNKYGHKIYGYLLPATPGGHWLRMELTQVTAACSAEVWLSSGPSPLASRLVVSAETLMMGRVQKASTKEIQDSEEIQLGPGTYYFEFLEKAFDGKCVATVKWKQPGDTDFKTISSDHFAMAVKLKPGGSEYADGWPVVEELQGDLPSNHLQSHATVQYTGDTIYPISELDVLENCEFTSQVAYPRILKKQYEGVYQIRESLVFPKDPTVFLHWRKKDKGNRFMSEERSGHVLELYKKAFAEKSSSGEVKINKIEETENKKAGSRFLLELDIQLEGESEVLHTSEYVYLATGASSLCHTSNFQWKRNVDVYLVVSVKNLGAWVQHLIHNMEHIYKVTGDERFELVIVDYQSGDLDVAAELRASSLPRYTALSPCLPQPPPPPPDGR
ncbi:N-acetyl-beta-glucosaminyl-glycoprotein 4-beta-N-acetylgalactosaminyltransferase 1 [Geodia barretti]|uniref:N-acetyl-beta-glucosaminyl-glycoprotein 4-beta-N-acetylgalactosaminyltransferase 1 n=1 Tax=Geodia barretti TaxID=519541 RepID=A0AA35W5W5_GEOBA|nr:N-acetyl-beta-glucosaminyl-glycoprotein 4-beta-N-acetylgalactosaminyltransferase 1 [Geodia barretti]